MSAEVEDILREAIRIINDHGWQRNSWPLHGPMPRCTRAAIADAAIQLGVDGLDAHGDALRRVSEAIYGKRGCIGGINDWEYRKATTQQRVTDMLHKAIEMGPAEVKAVNWTGEAF